MILYTPQVFQKYKRERGRISPNQYQNEKLHNNPIPLFVKTQKLEVNL